MPDRYGRGRSERSRLSSGEWLDRIIQRHQDRAAMRDRLRPEGVVPRPARVEPVEDRAVFEVEDSEGTQFELPRERVTEITVESGNPYGPSRYSLGWQELGMTSSETTSTTNVSWDNSSLTFTAPRVYWRPEATATYAPPGVYSTVSNDPYTFDFDQGIRYELRPSFAYANPPLYRNTPNQLRSDDNRDPRDEIVRANRFRSATVRRSVARRKARRVLEESLTPEQREQLERENKFVVVAQSGSRYEITRGHVQNVYKLNASGERIEQLCAHGPPSIPDEDHMLMQKLMLECVEDQFRRTANIAPLYQTPRLSINQFNTVWEDTSINEVYNTARFA